MSDDALRRTLNPASANIFVTEAEDGCAKLEVTGLWPPFMGVRADTKQECSDAANACVSVTTVRRAAS
jgi:hypothetical protein